MGYYGFAPYVPVAERRLKAKKKMEKLKKQGISIQPIELDGKKITKTFWGNAWNTHIENFSDFANRLPRGRSYVRNGSVCHLAITKGQVEAMVAGSELYKVHIEMQALPENKWQTIKQQCTGKITSLIDLLGGHLSDGVMKVVSDSNTGLFPLSNEITMRCSCPDWADMCKHVAAVLYGVGSRLDHSPEQLFLLRGVNHEELIDVSTTLSIEKTSARRRVVSDQLSDLFGVDMMDSPANLNSQNAMINTEPKKTKQKPSKKIETNPLPKRLTGAGLRRRRLSLAMTQSALAKQLQISPATVSKWEQSGREVLTLKEAVLDRLKTLYS